MTQQHQHSVKPGELYNQKSDVGCVICWKVSTKGPDGEKTGVKLKSCSMFNGPRLYCSSECFKVDWDAYNHKDECARLSEQVTFDDLEAQALRLEALKVSANKLYVAQKYEEAIVEYQNVKIGAIHLMKAAKEKHGSKEREAVPVQQLPDYLNIGDGLVLEDDLNICFKPDPLECKLL